MHVVHDIGYQPLVSHGGYSLDHFWPSPVGLLPPRTYLLYKNYVNYNIGGKGQLILTLHVIQQLVTSSSQEEKEKVAQTIPPFQKRKKSTLAPSPSRKGKEKVSFSQIAFSSILSWEEYWMSQPNGYPLSLMIPPWHRPMLRITNIPNEYHRLWYYLYGRNKGYQRDFNLQPPTTLAPKVENGQRPTAKALELTPSSYPQPVPPVPI